MTHSTLIFLSHRALQLTTLFLVVVPLTFGSESKYQLTVQRVVAALRDEGLIGHMVVTARRPALASAASIADLGAMTVSAPRETALARKETPQAKQHAL